MHYRKSYVAAHLKITQLCNCNDDDDSLLCPVWKKIKNKYKNEKIEYSK